MAVFDVLVAGGVRNDPLRALVALLALGFATALAVGTHLTGVAATSGLLSSGDELDRHADVQITAAGRGVDERLFPRIRSIAGVADARPVVAGSVVIGARANDPNAGETLRVDGVDLLQPIPGLSGSGIVLAGPYAPNGETLDTRLALDGGIVISDRVARKFGLSRGDRVSVLADGRAQDAAVAYVLPTDVSGVDSATAFVDVSTAQSLFASEGFLERIDCTVPRDLPAVTAKIAALLPPGTTVDRPRANANGLATLLAGLQNTIDWLAVVTLVLAALFTYNAVGASVAQRRKEIATLRGLGAKRSTIFRAFVLEGVLYGTFGSIGGAVAGTVAAQWAIARYVPGATRHADLAFSSGELVAIFAAVAIGIAVATCSAALPALSAMRVAPASALGAGRSDAIETSAHFRAVARACVDAVRRALGTRAPAAYLAAHELFATPRRSALVLVALALAVANAIGYTIASASFGGATQAWAAASMRGDVTIAARNLGASAPVAMPSPALARVRAIAGVATAIPARSFLVRSAAYGTFALRGDDANAPHALPSAAPDATETPAFVSPPLARKLHTRVGDRFTIATPSGVVALRVAGIPDDFADAEGVATVPFAKSAAWYRDDRADTIVVTATPGARASDVRARIARALATFRLDIETTTELRANTLALLDRSFAIARLLGDIALGIAIAGVCALLATLVLERRAQFGMLRYVGASRGFVGAMVVYEAALLAALACLIGTVAGVAGAQGALTIASGDTFGRSIPLELPLRMLSLTIVLTFAASLLAAIPAARSAGRIGADARPA